MKPVCVECGKDIIKINSQLLYCIYDDNLNAFKLDSVKQDDIWYRCVDCCAEYNESEIKDMIGN